MASPIGYLIHHDSDPSTAPDIANPFHSSPGTRTPLVATSGSSVLPRGHGHGHSPTSGSQALTRLGLDDPGNHNKKQSLYQCADCLRRSYRQPNSMSRCGPLVADPLQAVTLALNISR